MSSRRGKNLALLDSIPSRDDDARNQGKPRGQRAARNRAPSLESIESIASIREAGRPHAPTESKRKTDRKQVTTPDTSGRLIQNSNFEASAPLINDYKLQFLRRRWLQTLLGGVRFPEGAPLYAHLLQLLLLLVPFGIGGVCTALAETGVAAVWLAATLAGLFTLLYGILLVVVSSRATSGTEWMTARSGTAMNVGEEDEADFDGPCSAGTRRFLLPQQRSRPVVALHLSVAALLVAGTTAFLLPVTSVQQVFSPPASYAVFCFGWLSACLAAYGLLAGPPSEPSRFRPLLAPGYFGVPSRAGHIGILILVWAAVAPLRGGGTAGPSGADVVSAAAYILLAVYPLLWPFAMLPQLDCLAAWAGEQALVWALGGSHMATDVRLFVACLIAGLTLAVEVILLQYRSPQAGVVWAAVFGCLLACDAELVGRILRAAARSRKSNKILPLVDAPDSKPSGGAPGQPTVAEGDLLEVAWIAAVATASGLMAGLWEPASTPASQEAANVGFAVALFAAVAVCWALEQFQGVFLLGAVRNPFYPKSAFGREFMAGKRVLSWCASVRRIVVALLPISLVALLAMRQDSAWPYTTALLAMANVRAFRWCWQRPLDCALETAVVLAIELASGQSTASWHRLPLLLRLAVLALVHDRLRELWAKLASVARAYHSFATIKSQRTWFATPLLVASVLAFPITLSIILLSVVLAAPLLPLFGLPLFVLGYPRPRRFWPTGGSSYCPSGDTMYYQQALPVFARYLFRAQADGLLGDPVAGATYLLRFQNRMVWAQVLEVGYRHCSFSFKGLELEETSCHTVEATRIEENFDSAFERESGSGRLNRHLMSTLTPIDALHDAAYSDTRNMLTGVIDSPDVPKLLRDMLLHTLVWVLQQECDAETLLGWGSQLRNQRHQANADITFPAKWHAMVLQTFQRHGGNSWLGPTGEAHGSLASAAVPTVGGNNDRDQMDSLLHELESARGARNTGLHPPRTIAQQSGNTFHYVVETCCACVTAENPSPATYCRVFQGTLPPTAQGWDAKLQSLVLKAYRYAIKATIDALIMGDTGIADLGEVADSLREFDSSWYLGPETGAAWADAVARTVPNLFNLSREEGSQRAGSHLMSVQDVTMRLGRLNEETVRSEWAGLELELIYMTNDDDERYSIQAHPLVLRNVTVQAADTPLGYHIFHTGPMHVAPR